MKSIPSLLLALIINFYGVHSYAADDNQGYCSKAETTADIVQCVNKHHEAEQEKMANLFKEIEANANDEDFMQKLEKNQQDWIAFRDDLCQIEGDMFKGGSLARVQQLDCYALMAQQRNRHLLTIMTSLEPTYIPEYSNPPRWVNVLVRDYPDMYWGFGAAKTLDTDCDGQDENLVQGLSTNNNMTLAIADSMETGRPKITILKFDDEKNCEVLNDYAVEFLPSPKPEEGDERQCLKNITIKTKACGDYGLRYDSTTKTYEMNKTDQE